MLTELPLAALVAVSVQLPTLSELTVNDPFVTGVIETIPVQLGAETL